jgi:hypothetical protein
MRDYKTKDIKVSSIVNKLKEFYGTIDGIKGKA